MDEDSRSTPVSPGPAEDENAGLEASNSHKDSNSKREDGSLDPKPSGSEGKVWGFLLFSALSERNA